MTDPNSGWLTDPTGRHRHRYWDGSAWTDHVADDGVLRSDPYAPVDASADAPVVRRAAPGGGRSKVLVVGLALLAVLAVVATSRALDGDGGGDGNGDRDRADEISSTIAATLENDGLRETEADCVGDEVVDALGTHRLADVRFEDGRIAGDVPDDLAAIVAAALETCGVASRGVDLDGAGEAQPSRPGGGDPTSGGSGTGSFTDRLVDQYQSTLGLSLAQATCLADAMIQAGSGELSEADPKDQLKAYLDRCDIAASDLDASADG